MSKALSRYRGFLGIDEKWNKAMVYDTRYRELTLNGRYVHPVIITTYNSVAICSCTNEYKDMCRSIFKGKDSMLDILAALRNKYIETGFDTITNIRYILDTDVNYKSDAIAVDQNTLRNSRFNIKNDIEDYIRGKKQIIDEGRQFALIRDSEILSTAFISDIYNDCANIVVFTPVEHRHRGYGSQVVKAVINWCSESGLTPFYLVSDNNFGSIGLVENLRYNYRFIEKTITRI